MNVPIDGGFFSDSDGSSDEREQLFGDRNIDGISDHLQDTVASFASATGADVTVVVALPAAATGNKSFAGLLATGIALESVTGESIWKAHAPDGLFPAGVLSFAVIGLDAGQSAGIQLLLGDGTQGFDTLMAKAASEDWQLVAGATFANGVIAAQFTDGGLHDRDGMANGRIELLLAPAIVDSLPILVAQPHSHAIAAGGAVTLSVVAIGLNPFSYQWYRNGVVIPGATAANYELPSVQGFHAGAYTVGVENAVGSSVSVAATLSVTAPAASASRMLNLSTRALSLTNENVLIPGFVISGSKRMLIRAVGPKLTDFGVPGVLPDPRMVLKQWDGQAYQDYAANNDWGDNANLDDIIATTGALFAFGLDQGSGDAVLLLDLPAGQYTVVTDDEGGLSGVAIVELYDADDPGGGARLVNISTRGFVGTGADIMIPGIVISQEGPKTLLVRAVGPTLGSFGVTETLQDPQMTIYHQESDGNQTAILYNNDWEEISNSAYTAQVAAQVSAFGLDAGTKDAALVITLQPGLYTVLASGADGGTGVALVEVYEVLE